MHYVEGWMGKIANISPATKVLLREGRGPSYLLP
jgi:hypothetical protein